jgi:hypothetical protein
MEEKTAKMIEDFIRGEEEVEVQVDLVETDESISVPISVSVPGTPEKTTRCGQIDHHWEECTQLSFVTKGCLKERNCDACGVKMMGTKRQHDDTEGCWPSRVCVVCHCTRCKMVLCPGCKLVSDAGTPAQ